LELMRKITVKEDAALTALFPARSATTLKVHLKSGKVVIEKVEYPKGHPENPVTDEEIELKFRQLTKSFLTESQVDAILDFVWALERQTSVTPLFESCIIR
jgi:2-methylcitrate dehydratase